MRRDPLSAARSGILVPTVILAMSVAPLPAQVTVIDEGTFSLLVRGTRIGREDFSIRRTTGGELVARGNLLRADARSTVVVNVDSTGTPSRFRMETLRLGRQEEEVTGERRGALWSGLVVRPTGERGSEFRLPRGTVLADELVVHHLWFMVNLDPRPSRGRLRARQMEIDTVLVESAGEDRVLIGLDELDARKWVVRGQNGREVLHEVWTDPQGRLLRVRIPSEEFEALRDEPPNETPGH